MMIRIKTHVVLALLLLVTNCLIYAEVIPLEVTRLDEQRNAAIKKIDEKYIEELEKIKMALTKAGNLESALAVDSRIKSIQGQADVIGTWSFKNHSDGHVGIVKFNSDSTCNLDGKYPGKWEIKGNQLVISYDNRSGLHDRYDLPIRNGKLTGMNTPKHKLTITRKTE